MILQRPLFYALLLWVTLGCQAQPDPASPQSHHSPDGGFVNPYATHESEPGFRKLMKWFWEREKPNPSDSIISRVVPRVSPDYQTLHLPNSGDIQVTWLGHSTFLVQMEGMNILTDPIFSDRCSPVQWAGPKRLSPPALPLDSLPRIDLVVISHNHYDHLDRGTVEHLGSSARWLVPLKVKSWFQDMGIETVEELDWWDSTRVGDLKFVCTPSQHFSGRTPFDRNETLWAGWAITGATQRFWFGGDTGYNPIQFKNIGTDLGPFDLALIPIGAYDPRWIMKNHHVNPEEAVQIHLDIRSLFSIGMHWGTYILTDEPIQEPAERLKLATQASGLSNDSFITAPLGKTFRIPVSPTAAD
ncbi:MAG: MBL fold metallo-hydrolase [Lentisphaeria bacterium]|nr:MBL fold metallo-hydrolase [Candidatus Neomarinimicrobiota bacterium]MCF7842742.1 MBL fold metallo-hydrolase [Lentisphaeria bacterium]